MPSLIGLTTATPAIWEGAGGPARALRAPTRRRGARPGVVVASLEDQRLPARGAELLVDLDGQPLHVSGVGAVLRQVGPGRVGERDVRPPAPPLRAADQQLAVGSQATGDVLGELGPVNPDDDPGAAD